MKLTAWIALTLAGIITVAASGAASDMVEIRLRGHYYSEPATVRITVAVEPSPENRRLVIQADSEHYFRSSALMLDGEKEKRLHSVEFKSLPAGAYVLRAEVRSLDDVLAMTQENLLVTGIGGR